MKTPEIVWTRLHLPRPLDPSRVLETLVHLAADPRSSLVVFELRSDDSGLMNLLGCHPTSVWPLRKLLGDHLPGISFSTAPGRRAVSEAGSLHLEPRAMPLRTGNPLEVTRALLSAMSVRLRSGEAQVVQIVLGRRRRPRTIATEAPSPHSRWWDALIGSERLATADERQQLRLRAESAGFETLLRVGTAGADPGRTRRLTLGLHAAITTTQGPGVRLSFEREAPQRVTTVRLPRRWPLDLACTELLGLLGWPLGDDDLPGVPGLHPKPLRPAAAVHRGERVFGVPVAPGDDRPIGIAAADALLHTVAYGPTNSGKSTVMLHLIEADMKAGRPVAVLDPKRQLIDDILARVPAERLDDVVVLDVGQDQPIGYNPLDLHGRDPDVAVDGIMAVFADLFSSGWGARTLDVFSGTLRSLARASVATGQPATLADIPRLLTDPSLRRRVVGQVVGDEGLAGFWAWYESLKPAAQANVIAAPLNKLRQLLLRPALMRTLDQRTSPFHLQDIWTKHLIVLVPLNEALIGAGTADLFGSLVVADLWATVQSRASEQHPQKRPGTVYVDEAPRFLRLATSLGDALAVSRSMGVGWFLAAQFVDQFPKDLRSAINFNARSQIVFGTQHPDAQHFARGSRDLTAEDFTSLDRFQAYANLVAHGQPQGWSLIRTLPPSSPSASAKAVADASRARWAPPAATPSATAVLTNQTADQPELGPESEGAAVAPVGRRRRRRQP